MKNLVLLIITYSLLLSNLCALPMNGQVVSGAATIDQLNDQMTITQSTEQAILNWDSFNIHANEHCHIQQLNAASTSLHRINSENGVSSVMGRLTSNGTVLLLNPSGFIFGKDCAIDVANFVATQSDLTDKNFIDKNFNFTSVPDCSGYIRNEGQITVQQSGLAALVGLGVENKGYVSAHQGEVVLASGTEFTVDFGKKNIQFSVEGKVRDKIVDENKKVLEQAVLHSGSIVAEGGRVIISAQVAEEIVDNAINIEGIIEAKSLQQKNGVIILSAGEEGSVQISGKLNVQGIEAGETGGDIHIKGKEIKILNTAELNASGNNGGGNITAYSKDFTLVEENVRFDASATDVGNGGAVNINSDNKTWFDGSVFAEGGKDGGNGGFIETSGKNHIHSSFKGSAKAPRGLAGTWELDPTDVTISTALNSNPLTPLLGTWTPSGTPSNVQASQIVDLLNLGTNVTIKTTGAFAGAGDIIVQNNVVATNALGAGATFSLQADRHVTINAGVTVNIAGTATFTAGVSNNSGQFINNGKLSVAGTTNITAPGGITFSAATPLSLAGAVNLNSHGNNGNINFFNTVNGPGAWVLTAGTGNVSFNNKVGGITPLGGLNIVSATTTNVAQNISTNNAPIIFSSSVNLSSAASTISSGTGLITFGGLINGRKILTVNSTGATTFSGAIGAVTPLASLRTNAGGSTSIGGNITTTNGAVSFGDAVTLLADATIASGTGAITFSNTINGARALTLNSTGSTTFSGAIGGVRPLASLSTNAGGSTSIGGNITTTNGIVSFADPVTLTANATIASGTGAITFSNTINGARALTLNSTGLTTFSGAIGGTTALTSLTTNAGGTTSIGGNITTGTVNFGNAVTLTNNLALDAGAGLITFGGILNGNHNLNLTTSSNILFGGTVGAGTPLQALTVTNANDVTVNSTLNAGSYNQLAGTGTTDFGIGVGLNVSGNITVNTNIITGNLTGGATVLNGTLGLNMDLNNVQVTSLLLNGLHGGTVVGTVNGFGGLRAAMLTHLGVGYAGMFTMNGYVLPIIPPVFPTDLTGGFGFSVLLGIIFPGYIYDSFFEEFIVPAMPVNHVYEQKFLLDKIKYIDEKPLVLQDNFYKNKLVIKNMQF